MKNTNRLSPLLFFLAAKSHCRVPEPRWKLKPQEESDLLVSPVKPPRQGLQPFDPNQRRVHFTCDLPQPGLHRTFARSQLSAVVSSAPFWLFCTCSRRRVEPRLFSGLPHWVCSPLHRPDDELPAYWRRAQPRRDELLTSIV